MKGPMINLPFLDGRVEDVVTHYLAAVDFTEQLSGNWSEAAKGMALFDCTAFCRLARWHLHGLTPEQIGHDFWLTRNGHGTGFWDRGLDDQGDALTTLCKIFGEQDAYEGDDGLIYLE